MVPVLPRRREDEMGCVYNIGESSCLVLSMILRDDRMYTEATQSLSVSDSSTDRDL